MGHDPRPVDTSSDAAPPSLLAKHEFLLRRLHSLSGLVPVGVYMVIHLLTNATLNDSPAWFQRSVYQIHGLGNVLWVVEWVFIFIPLIFHSVLGVVFIKGALPNNSTYRYTNNHRYTLQRASGMIAFVFIFAHVFHMHGWFHVEAWSRHVVEPLGGGQFRPHNAGSSVGLAMQSFAWQAFYVIGVLASVFHLANGIWTMGITWGLWISPEAQRRANWVALGFGVVLTVVSISAFVGAVTVDIPEAMRIEDQMHRARVEAGEIEPGDLKKLNPEQVQRVEALQRARGGVSQGEPPAEPAPEE